MENFLPMILVSLIIGVVLFKVFRELVTWYWKINERISLANKTNFLLEKILFQLGAANVDEITIEEITTGNRKKVKVDSWIKSNSEHPGGTGYRIVQDGLAT